MNRTLTGLTMETTDNHFIRSTFEGICFQTKDVMQSMLSDTGHSIKAMNVDGGMVTSNTFIQILTDICCIPVGKLCYITFPFMFTHEGK